MYSNVSIDEVSVCKGEINGFRTEGLLACS